MNPDLGGGGTEADLRGEGGLLWEQPSNDSEMGGSSSSSGFVRDLQRRRDASAPGLRRTRALSSARRLWMNSIGEEFIFVHSFSFGIISRSSSRPADTV